MSSLGAVHAPYLRFLSSYPGPPSLGAPFLFRVSELSILCVLGKNDTASGLGPCKLTKYDISILLLFSMFQLHPSSFFLLPLFSLLTRGISPFTSLSDLHPPPFYASMS